MWLIRIFRYLLYLLGMLMITIILALLIMVVPVDRTNYRDKEFYGIMMHRLDSMKNQPIDVSSGTFVIGYGLENLTPPFPVATAGYGNRRGRNYTSVHDSIYVRALVVDNGRRKVAIISADLLIIPPTVTELLNKKLPEIGFSLDNTYLNATHTHNSIGNWGEGAAGLLYGSYSDSVVSFIADRIISSIQAASLNGRKAKLKFGSIAVPNAVRHRIDGQNGGIDSLLRVVEIVREDSSKLVMVSFNAHPTCLFAKDLELSRDYPGELVDSLESDGYDFAMFISGAVGSHGCNPPEYGKPCLTWMTGEILSRFSELRPALEDVRDSTLTMIRVPLALGDPQVKLMKSWRLRPWVFRKALGEYQAYLTALRLGDIVFLGTPCDFSGELRKPIDSTAFHYALKPIITSFNGQYIGYITNDKYYDNPHYETRLMNWYGPGNGAYLSECMVQMVEAVGE